MSVTFKKIDKEYLYTDDSVNVYGFRLLTSGYLIDKFKANPIGFYLHAPEEMPREEGVLVSWSDFRIDGDKVWAKPTINLNHPRGQRTVDEIENGFLNAASVGKIVVLEISEDPKDLLAGQTGPTCTKWYHKELSLVDIPGNENALTASKMELFDASGKPINLTDFVEKTLSKIDLSNDLNKPQMQITKSVLIALNLSDNTDESTALAAIRDLQDRAKRVDTLTSEKAVIAKELSDLKQTANTAQVAAILETALADKRITKELSDTLKTDYADNPDGLKKVVAAMKPYQSLVDEIDEKDTEKWKDLASKTWTELDKAGKLQDLKDGNLTLFKQKFKAQFGKDYSG